jgi:hypothetical protein
MFVERRFHPGAEVSCNLSLSSPLPSYPYQVSLPLAIIQLQRPFKTIPKPVNLQNQPTSHIWSSIPVDEHESAHAVHHHFRHYV